MRKLLSVVFAGCIAVLTIASPIAYKRWHDKSFRNFHVVETGVLYRSGQLPFPRLRQLVADHGIRTVVCLRDGNDPADQEEANWIKSRALNFVRIPPRQWYPDATGKVPADLSVQTFRDIMDNPANYPVLVHCFAGIHRTGMMCAVYRMDHQGWSNEQAMTEMRMHGYTLLDDHEDVQSYLLKYRPPQASKTRSMPIAPVSRTNDRP